MTLVAQSAGLLGKVSISPSSFAFSRKAYTIKSAVLTMRLRALMITSTVRVYFKLT